jgi:hypothetical protein
MRRVIRGTPLARIASILLCSLAIYLVYDLLRTLRAPISVEQSTFPVTHSYRWLKFTNLYPSLIHHKHVKLSRGRRLATDPPAISINTSLPAI